MKFFVAGLASLLLLTGAAVCVQRKVDARFLPPSGSIETQLEWAQRPLIGVGVYSSWVNCLWGCLTSRGESVVDYLESRRIPADSEGETLRRLQLVRGESIRQKAFCGWLSAYASTLMCRMRRHPQQSKEQLTALRALVEQANNVEEEMAVSWFLFEALTQSGEKQELADRAESILLRLDQDKSEWFLFASEAFEKYYAIRGDKAALELVRRAWKAHPPRPGEPGTVTHLAQSYLLQRGRLNKLEERRKLRLEQRVKETLFPNTNS